MAYLRVIQHRICLGEYYLNLSQVFFIESAVSLC